MKAKRLEDMEEIDKTDKCDVQLVISLIHFTRSNLRTKRLPCPNLFSATSIVLGTQ